VVINKVNNRRRLFRIILKGY